MARSSSIETKNDRETGPACGDAPNAQAIADYIRSMSAELATMAEQSHLHLLHYLLDMVRLEAEAVLAGQGGGGRGGSSR